MNRFFIKHKLSINDVTHLSDSDSELVINHLKLKPENFIEIETYEAIFLGVITDTGNKSVEIEILEILSQKDTPDTFDLSIAQSLVGREKFNYIVEKSVEIGIDMIIPIESQYSNVKKNKAIKEYGLWNKIVKDATEQSRNTKPTIIEKPINLEDLNTKRFVNKICLSTENINSMTLREYLKKVDIKGSFLIAIGPEKGWGSKDLEYFKNEHFDFVRLDGNVLRTETASLVIGSIIKYLKGEI